jgi:hypothetical protein
LVFCLLPLICSLIFDYDSKPNEEKSIAIPHMLVRGWPSVTELSDRLLGYFGIPALFVGGYALAAYLGMKRMERLLSSESD